MKTDIEIARSIELVKIKQVARETGIPVEHISNYGRYIAKVDESQINEEKVQQSNLILVTAITPTKAGIGKTTVSIGLALGLNKIGKKTICRVRSAVSLALVTVILDFLTLYLFSLKRWLAEACSGP